MDILNFIQQYGGIIFAALQVMLSLAIYGKFSNKFLKQFLKEVDLLYHRTIEEAEKDISTVSQKFQETRPAYVLNESTNQLEQLPAFEDIQAKIDSYLSTALDRILDRYLPTDVQSTDEVADYASVKTDLSELGELYERAEQLKERYGLPDDMRPDDVFHTIQARADELGKKIKERSAYVNAETEKTQS